MGIEVTRLTHTTHWPQLKSILTPKLGYATFIPQQSSLPMMENEGPVLWMAPFVPPDEVPHSLQDNRNFDGTSSYGPISMEIALEYVVEKMATSSNCVAMGTTKYKYEHSHVFLYSDRYLFYNLSQSYFVLNFQMRYSLAYTVSAVPINLRITT